ncbi:MAG: MFS transporter [Patescibacteria group bacterium]
MKEILRTNAIYVGNFLRALGVYIPYVVYSTFLSQFMPEDQVGLAFSLSAAVSLVFLLIAPRIFARFRTHRVLIAAAATGAFGLVMLSFVETATTAVLFFIISWVSGWIVALALDVILEKIVGLEETSTGMARGLFLTASNMAVLISSIIIAVTLTNGDYWRVFLLAAAAFALCGYLALNYYATIPHVATRTVRIMDAIQTLSHNRSLLGAVVAQFLLQLIFVTSAVFIPLYLHNHLGWSWSAIGTIFALNMLPFVIFQLPIGWVADHYTGEKEFMLLGTMIAGVSYLALASGFETAFAIGAIIVLIHIGGAILEISAESFFFKQVNAGDSNLISFYRTLRQGAAILAPLIGSLVLATAPFSAAFLTFGIIIILGSFGLLLVRDTR